MLLTKGKSVRAPITLAGALMLSTAFVAPAWAQIETVVVTAEKRAEDIQTVPIAVTAFSSKDIGAHQIVQFKDLQFAIPNVTYTNTNFGGANFQIRGIGIAAIGYDAESGTAIHVNDVFLANPPITEATFFDVERIETLRGPQSTLYGRGAVGGTVNIFTNKPNLDEVSGNAEVSYGNFNQTDVKAMLNIPIVSGELGIRIAGDWLRHNGFVLNIADNKHVDSNDTYSGRASIRWQPDEDTTVDLVGSYSHEGDSHMRAVKQLCTRDPTAILGCLPDSLHTDAINVNAQFTNTVSSIQGLQAALGGLLGPVDAGNLGLFDLTQPAHVAPGNVNPSSLRQINSDFDPKYKTNETYAEMTVKHKFAPWLNAIFVGAYEDHSYFSQESYNNIGPVPLDQARLGVFGPGSTTTALGDLYHILSGGNGIADFVGAISTPTFAFTPAYAAFYAPYFSSHPGQLPVSALTNFGATGNSIAYFSPNQTVYDQSDAYNKQYSAELRFNSSFDGPVNFLVAGYYLRTTGYGDYFVPGNVIDYPGIVLGSILGPLNPPHPPFPFINPINPGPCGASGCNFAPTYYHNWGRNLELESKAFFGEVYYDAIPDELKFTLGIRYTDDRKDDLNRIAFLTGFAPIGSTNENASDNLFGDPLVRSVKSFDKFTGRAVVNWTPKVDFTEATLVYASYSRGYKSGGFNPGVQAGLTLGVNPSFQPEGLDAFEIGTKNTLLDGTLQANLTGWYYNYQNFQVSAIIQNTSVNSNIGVRLWGLEGEFFYQPNEDWAFSLNLGHTDSRVGNFSLVDPRIPSGGSRADVILVKDATATGGAGQNCVVYKLPAGAFNTPADAGVSGFFAPPAAAGGETGLASSGIPFANFGACAPGARPSEATMEAAGFTYGDPTRGPIGSRDDSGGVAKSLKGNQTQYTPPYTVSFGAQYTHHLDNGYTLVPRVDMYWQADSWLRIFHDGADRQRSYTDVNALLTLNAPEEKWYAQFYVKNVFDTNAQTGGYLTSSTSALYTNAFLVDPRTLGVRVGARW